MAHLRTVLLAVSVNSKYEGVPTDKQITDYLQNLLDKEQDTVCDPWFLDYPSVYDNAATMMEELGAEESFRAAMQLRDFVEKHTVCELEPYYLQGLAVRKKEQADRDKIKIGDQLCFENPLPTSARHRFVLAKVELHPNDTATLVAVLSRRKTKSGTTKRKALDSESVGCVGIVAHGFNSQ